MPHAVSPGAQVNAVEGHTAAVQQLLEAARRIKPSQTIQPPLTYADLSEDIKAAIPNSDGETPKIEAAQYAAIETAFRSIFYGLVVHTGSIRVQQVQADPVSCRPRPRSTTPPSARSGISSTSSSSSPIKVWRTADNGPAERLRNVCLTCVSRRVVRPGGRVLARGRVAREPDDRRLPEGVRLPRRAARAHDRRESTPSPSFRAIHTERG